jgi:hypothetical protein
VSVHRVFEVTFIFCFLFHIFLVGDNIERERERRKKAILDPTRSENRARVVGPLNMGQNGCNSHELLICFAYSTHLASKFPRVLFYIFFFLSWERYERVFHPLLLSNLQEWP